MTTIGSEYAEALYGLASDEGLDDRILSELTAIRGAVEENADYLRVLSSPAVTREERCRILDEAFGGRVHPYVLSFLKLLAERGLAKRLPALCGAYEGLYNEGHGILPVCAVSAVPLKDSQRERLTRVLEQKTGKTVRLRCRVDGSVLGGLRLDYDGVRIDDTVRSRLDRIQSMLETTTL